MSEEVKGCFGSFSMYNLDVAVCGQCPQNVACGVQSQMTIDAIKDYVSSEIDRRRLRQSLGLNTEDGSTELLTKHFKRTLESKYDSPQDAFRLLVQGNVPSDYEELYLMRKVIEQSESVTMSYLAECVRQYWPEHGELHCQRLAIVTLEYFTEHGLLQESNGEYTIIEVSE